MKNYLLKTLFIALMMMVGANAWAGCVYDKCSFTISDSQSGRNDIVYLEPDVKAYFGEVLQRLGTIVQRLNDERLNAAYSAAQAALESGNYSTVITAVKALYDKLIVAAKDYVASAKVIPAEGREGITVLKAAISAAEQALAGLGADFNAINTTISNLVDAMKAFIDANKATGINEVNSNARNNDAIYTIGGTKVSKPQKGLYIVNGKLVVIK